VRAGASEAAALTAAIAATGLASYLVTVLGEPAAKRLLSPIGRLAAPAPAPS
jgi:hypothetical protein